MSICKDNLIKSIQSAHRALIAYSSCICQEATAEESETFYQYGLVLASQLQELRALCIRSYGIDPIEGFHPVSFQPCQRP